MEAEAEEEEEEEEEAEDDEEAEVDEEAVEFGPSQLEDAPQSSQAGLCRPRRMRAPL